MALPLAIALLTIGNPAQSWADTTDNNSNSADDMSLAAKDNLNNNDVAVDNSNIIEDNLNGPIGNDVQVADQAANDNSTAVKDVLNDNTLYDFNNDTSNHSINVSDIHIAVAASVLGGAVTGNTINMSAGTDYDIETGYNCLASGTYTSNGISAVSMNTGVMSQTQQSINVQANITQ
jgi:hypothetical protein